MSFEGWPRAESSPSLGLLLETHWKLVGACTLGLALAGAAVTTVLPKSYLAETEFLVRDSRQNLVMMAGANTGSSSVGDVNEEGVNSEIQLLQSRDLLAGVAVRTKLYAGAMRDGLPADPTRLDHALRTLRSRLSVTALRKTDIIQVQLSGPSPGAATEALRELTRLYLAANIQAHGSPSSHAFFERERELARQRMDEADARLRDFRQSTGAFDEDQQRSALVSNLEDTQNRLEGNRAEVDEQSARVQEIANQLAGTADREQTNVKSSVNQLLVDRLQGQLADLENRRVELLVKFRADDRVVVGLDQEIANTRRELEAASTSRAEERSSDINPVYHGLKEQMASARIALSGLFGRRAGLLREKVDAEDRLQRLGAQTGRLAELENDRQQAREAYQQYDKRAEEARVAEAMDQQHIANVTVIETPAASSTPISPSLRVDTLLGAFVGLIFGLLLAYLRLVRAGVPRAPEGRMSETSTADAVTEEFFSMGAMK